MVIWFGHNCWHVLLESLRFFGSSSGLENTISHLKPNNVSIVDVTRIMRLTLLV